jgi:hypothetical protein
MKLQRKATMRPSPPGYDEALQHDHAQLQPCCLHRPAHDQQGQHQDEWRSVTRNAASDIITKINYNGRGTAD